MFSNSNNRYYVHPTKLLLGTLVISSFAVGMTFLTSKLAIYNGSGIPSMPELLVLLVTIGNLTAIWYALMTLTQTRDAYAEVIACTMIGAGGGMLGVIQLAALQQSLPIAWLFHLTCLAYAIQGFGIGYLLALAFQMVGRWPMYFAAANAGAVVLSGIVFTIGQSWWPMGQSVAYFAVVANVTQLIQPLVLVGLCSLVASLRLHPTSVRESLKLRFFMREGARRDLITCLYLLSSAVVLSAVNLIAISTRTDSALIGQLDLAALTLAWIPALWHCFMRIREMHDRYQEHFLMARFSGGGARRFVRRNYSEQHAWAATVGLRTACFLIDHDPDDSVSRQLPATLYQIRNDEIYRCVVEVLGTGSLHSRVVGNQIMGSIDPEDALRPCVDVLSMFACLYLDAMPLIERRLKGLAALLPIIDPQLALSMHNSDMNKTWRRNFWLFHFDFNWADQHIVSTPKYTHYEVHMNDVPTAIRTAVFEHLQKKNRLGNFIWVGEKARNRILEEAPFLSSIIESWPVPLPQSNDEILVFLIKFEELVPRLQKYFNLDRLRSLLRDFDPSNESNQFLNIIDLQLLQARTTDDVFKILDTIANYPWRGFREKDHALQTIIKAYGIVQHLNQQQASAGIPMPAKMQSKFMAAITSIGYPSQILHLAQLRKFHLRDPDKVIEAARDTNHPRFHEAWLVMSTTNANRYSADELRVFLNFLALVPTDRKLRRDSFVLGKSLAAWVNMGRELKDAPTELHAAILNRFGAWLVEQHADADSCAYYMDCKTFIEQHLDTQLVFEAVVAQKLADYFNFLRQTLGSTSPEIAAIATRWQLIAAAAPKQAA